MLHAAIPPAGTIRSGTAQEGYLSLRNTGQVECELASVTGLGRSVVEHVECPFAANGRPFRLHAAQQPGQLLRSTHVAARRVRRACIC